MSPAQSNLYRQIIKPHKWLRLVKTNTYVRCEVFTEVKIQIKVFWIVTPCSVAVGYQFFREPYCLHLQGDIYLCLLGTL